MSTQALNLYFSPGSCSLAPHILLREAELPFNLVQCNLKASFPEQYRQLNPKGKVPILQTTDNGENITITENPAIMTYISQVAPQKHLFGKTPLETVRCYEWLNYLSGTLHAQAFRGVFRPNTFHNDESTHADIRKKSVENVKACYQFIEEKLSERNGTTWAVGDGFTVVDAYLFVFYRWGNASGIDMEGTYPKYTELAKRVAERKSVGDAAKEEAIPILGV